ncbi:uncharacterized protein VNE69_06217 [Vairimorpha necatrix]|uniref:Uncharacterized protein n=1 Tax=Vairimorpha necatrix TaxID=6039 RepID=A0AAX4JD15_9MICR
MHDYVDYNENFIYKVKEYNEHEIFGPKDLKNEIIINKKTQNDIFLQDETQSNCDDPVKNLDLETSDLKKIHWFEEDIDQLQESNTANDRPIETSERKLLKELKNEIEKFRKERIFNLVTEKGPRNKNIVNKKTKGLIKKKNCDILEFKKDFIYNLKNKELKKLRKLILHAYIPADVKIVLLEIIEVFKSFIGGYKNRKNLLTKKKNKQDKHGTYDTF